MEAFSLLKYWKGGGSVCSVAGGGSSGEDSGGVRGVNASRHANTTTTTTTTTLDAADHAVVETDEDEDDEGPFFDLEFALPEGDDDDDDDETLGSENDSGSNEQNHGRCCAEVVEVEEVVVEGEKDALVESSSGDGDTKFKFTLSSSSSASAASNNTTTTTSSCSYNDCADPNLPLSPSDGLFFKGRLVPVETSEVLITGTDGVMNSKAHQFQVASLLKPATKFRVFMSDRLKKSKLQPTQQPPKRDEENLQNEHQKQSNQSISNKFFTVKCKVEEVPFVSLFTRDNSSRGGGPSKPQTQKETTAEDTATEKRNSKDVVQKYLKKVKPLYIRVSNRVVVKKLRLAGQLTFNSVSSDSGRKQNQPPESGAVPNKEETDSSSSAKSDKGEGRKVVVIVEEDGNVAGDSKGMSSSCTGVGVKQGGSNLASGFKVMCKHLGKSKSASSAVVHSVPPTGATAGDRRRDDSLLQQQDGIQSAILHCKRSFNASRDSESATMLSRSARDPPCNEKSSEDGNNNIVALEEADENSTVAQ